MSASPAKAMTPVVGLATTLSRLTVIEVLFGSVSALGGIGACGWTTSLGGGLAAFLDASGPGTSAFGTVVKGRFCSGTLVLAVSGRLMIFGITGVPAAAVGGGACGGGDGDLAAGAAGVA